MDLAKSLVKIVARAFYETKHILVVDALMIHSALRDDDLAHLLGMQTKELHKLCGKLKEDRLLAVRPEVREGTQRPINRTYYYVDFRETIDAIKYRAHKITKEVESSLRTTEEKKDFVCPRCKSRYALMDVLDNPAPDGFNCHKCGHLLDREDENIGDSSGQRTLSRLFDQLNSIIKLLQQIDEVYIPEYVNALRGSLGNKLTPVTSSNDFESAFSNAVPVSRNQITNPTGPTTIAPIAPTAVKGDATTAAQLEVQLTSTSEKSAAELVAEQARKAALAAQNQLPIWHTNSTVTGEETALGRKEAAAAQERQAANGFLGLKKEEEERKALGNEKEEDALAQYYAELAREKEKEEREDREDDETSGEDYEDDFEDVGGIGTESGGLGTPAVGPMTVNSKLINGTAMARLKSQESESGSSPATGTTTPAFTAGNMDEDTILPVPVAKRAKVEDQRPQEEDSEEEEEFEDV
ncbi:hypothetical protein GP486_004442 [Trichoglossum hirsutum]|uniref:HTH TFE/IIEalpha-type domain-containing protein n=1 Tax=Trichoglossum hirsutum TaxID=265104 RepID=A0A9P8RP45_9PEZI|nr:hypothetical protein GP486_004442 [Trichoglossum hirsutum]